MSVAVDHSHYNITVHVCIFLVDIFHIISVATLIYLNLSSANANLSQTCDDVFFDLHEPRCLKHDRKDKMIYWNEHQVIRLLFRIEAMKAAKKMYYLSRNWLHV